MSQTPFMVSIDERRLHLEAINCATPLVQLSEFKIDASMQERTSFYAEGQLAWNEYCDLQK